MQIRPIPHSDDALLHRCISLAEKGYLDNLILLGDLFPPCNALTEVFGVFDEKKSLLSCFTIFSGFPHPSVVPLAKQPSDVSAYMLQFLQEHLPGYFTIVTFDIPKTFLSKFFSIKEISIELCMVLDKTENLPVCSSPLIKRASSSEEYKRISSFYKSINAYPWHPIQLKSGYYHYIELENKTVVACGGTHLETPKLAHLGNFFVLPEYRRQGFGKALVSIVSCEILKQKDLATLFVAQWNSVAISLYQKLGFRKYKPVSIFSLHNIA
ncbi:MAG: GNAT family N-acetyltransferase [Candidatus Hodarchaeota archaeon]